MKLIGYARVSTQGQGQEGHSLDEQEARIKAYARCHPDAELVGIAREIGSAKDMNRPGLLEILQELDEGEYDGIIITALDRLTRNMGDLIQLADDYFNAEKKNLISLTENINMETPTGRLLVFFLGVFGQWQREMISEHSKRTIAHLKSQNKRFNAHPEFGLMVNPTSPAYVIGNPAEQKTLARIKDLKAQGSSLTEISMTLENEGMFNRAGNPFSASAISKLCRKHGYTCTVYGHNYRSKNDYKFPDRFFLGGKNDGI